ncbi:MAG: hypothetical protein ACE5LV_02110 [Candidatus Aminicenantales bacterium]
MEKNLSATCCCWAGAVLLMALVGTGCVPGPKVHPPPEPEAKPELPPIPSGFVMKPYHHAMQEEMRKSYEASDEIIIGVFTGIHDDAEEGITFYFSDFSTFDKAALSWGPPQDVVLQVRSGKANPEIIRKDEFPGLIDLDKVGICWDAYQGRRSIFLVEGKMNLLFLQLEFDEAAGMLFRNLLDAYPGTEECRARDVFNLMVQNLILSR